MEAGASGSRGSSALSGVCSHYGFLSDTDTDYATNETVHAEKARGVLFPSTFSDFFALTVEVVG